MCILLYIFFVNVRVCPFHTPSPIFKTTTTNIDLSQQFSFFYTYLPSCTFRINGITTISLVDRAIIVSKPKAPTTYNTSGFSIVIQILNKNTLLCTYFFENSFLFFLFSSIFHSWCECSLFLRVSYS